MTKQDVTYCVLCGVSRSRSVSNFRFDGALLPPKTFPIAFPPLSLSLSSSSLGEETKGKRAKILFSGGREVRDELGLARPPWKDLRFVRSLLHSLEVWLSRAPILADWVRLISSNPLVIEACQELGRSIPFRNFASPSFFFCLSVCLFVCLHFFFFFSFLFSLKKIKHA